MCAVCASCALQLTIDDVFSPLDVARHKAAENEPVEACACHPHNFCKPIAKLEEDREELMRVGLARPSFCDARALVGCLLPSEFALRRLCSYCLCLSVSRRSCGKATPSSS